MENMSSSRRSKSRSGSNHGPASSIRTFTPRSASSLATTGPPAPAPTTMTSGSGTTSVLHPVPRVAPDGPGEPHVRPDGGVVQGPGGRVEPRPLRVHPAVGEHQEGVHQVAEVPAVLGAHEPEDLPPLVEVEVDEGRPGPDIGGVSVQKGSEEVGEARNERVQGLGDVALHPELGGAGTAVHSGDDGLDGRPDGGERGFLGHGARIQAQPGCSEWSNWAPAPCVSPEASGYRGQEGRDRRWQNCSWTSSPRS